MRHYKNKDYYYISYYSPEFVKVNTRYKVGVNIFILQYDGDMFYVNKVIDSDNVEEFTDKRFYPVSKWCVIGWKKEDVIKQIFEKDWYGD